MDTQKISSVCSKGFTRNLIFQSVIIFVGTSLIYGYNFSALNLPSRFIKEFYNSTYTDRGTPLTSHMLTFLFSFTVSVYLAGCFFGTLLAGCISKLIGRKKLVLISQIPQLLGSILQTISVSIKAPESLVVGRFISGLASGIALQIAPVYTAEIAPQNIRGAIVSGNVLALSIGLLLGTALTLDKIFGTKDLWMFALLMPIIPALFCLVVWVFLAESPRFLVLDKQDLQTAEKALQFLTQKEDVVEELDEIKHEGEALNGKQVDKYTFLQMIRSKEYRLPLLFAFLMPVTIQATAVSGVLLYTPGIFQNIGLDEEEIQYSVLGVYIVTTLGTLLAVYLVNRVGRRPLLIVSMGIIIILLLVLTLCIHFQNSASWLSYIGVACIIIYCIAVSVGPSNLLWVIPPELFKQGPRDVAVSFSVATTWINFVLFAFAFEFMIEAMGSFVFLLFMGLSLVLTLVFFWKLPETRNKTFQEIAEHFLEETIPSEIEIELKNVEA